jgi:hypothetical protein
LVRNQEIDQYLVQEFPPYPGEGDATACVCSDVWAQVESEDKLGCARGVVWAIIFEAVLAAAGMICWKFHLWPR